MLGKLTPYGRGLSCVKSMIDLAEGIYIVTIIIHICIKIRRIQKVGFRKERVGDSFVQKRGIECGNKSSRLV